MFPDFTECIGTGVRSHRIWEASNRTLAVLLKLVFQNPAGGLDPMLCCCESQWKDDSAVDLVPLRVLEKVAAEQVVPDVSERTSELMAKASHLGIDKEPCYVFTVGLHRAPPDTNYGLDLSAAGRLCLVNAVSEGSLVASWNKMWLEKGVKEHTVQKYDRLVGLNTDRPSSGKELMQKLRDCTGQVAIVMQRPVVRRITVQKLAGQELGITIVDGEGFLIVASIGEGVIRDHNQRARAEELIHLPSVIAAVNGKTSSGSEMLKFMQDADGPFEILLLHYD